MRLTKEGLTLLGESLPDALPALLETVVVTPDGAVCRSTAPVLLLGPGVH